MLCGCSRPTAFMSYRLPCTYHAPTAMSHRESSGRSCIYSPVSPAVWRACRPCCVRLASSFTYRIVSSVRGCWRCSGTYCAGSAPTSRREKESSKSIHFGGSDTASLDFSNARCHSPLTPSSALCLMPSQSAFCSCFTFRSSSAFHRSLAVSKRPARTSRFVGGG